MSESGQSGQELQQSLVTRQATQMFYKEEIKTMCGIGWPMLVSFFCRFGMASEDSAFVGHLSTKAMSALGDSMRSQLFGQAAAALIAYMFLGEVSRSNSTSGSGYGPKQFLAAAGLSDMVTNILIIPPLAFNMSLNALVSQAMGSGNKKMAGTWLQMSVLWLTASYLPVLVSFFFVSPMLRVLGFDSDICELAGTYARFNVFWPIPNGWYQCMRFYFQAQGITRPAMYNNIAFLVVNALLNWIFVFGGPFRSLGWNGLGFVGAAISLSCSRSLQPLFYWLYMFAWKKAHLDTWPSLCEKTFLDREHVRSFLAMALPQIGTLVFQAVVGQATTLLIAKLGEAAISASAASSAATMVLTGGLSPTLSMVGGIRVGYHLGNNQPTRASKVAYLSMLLGAFLTSVLGVMTVIFGSPIISVVTDDPAVQEPAVSILPAVMLNLVASIMVSIGTQGVLTSQGRTKAVTFLSMGFELPLSVGSTALLVFVFKASLLQVYWAQAAVSLLEAAVIFVIIGRSNWEGLATAAQVRQGVEETSEETNHRESVISMQARGGEKAASEQDEASRGE